jgi:predicted RNase H-like HicB family nuclease
MEKDIDENVVLLTATIVPPDEECPEYSGWINEEAGLIAQGETIEDVKKSLLDLYWIKKSVEHKEKKKNDKKTKS